MSSPIQEEEEDTGLGKSHYEVVIYILIVTIQFSTDTGKIQEDDKKYMKMYKKYTGSTQPVIL